MVLPGFVYGGSIGGPPPIPMPTYQNREEQQQGTSERSVIQTTLHLERIISICKVEYAWNPSKCSHCKVSGHKDSNCGILIANQKKEEEEKSKIEKGKEGVSIDLMQVLLASTKEVKDKNDGFETVVKKNKGNKSKVSSNSAVGERKKFAIQGQCGNNSKNERLGAEAGNRIQGQNGNNPKNKNFGVFSGNSVKGYYGNNSILSKNRSVQGGKASSKKEQGYNGKNSDFNGKKGIHLVDKGQSSNSKGYDKKGRGSGGSLYPEGNLGSSSDKGIKQDYLKKEEVGNKIVFTQSYVPKSGGDFKANSNFDKFHQNVKGVAPINLHVSNSFGVLQDSCNEESEEALYEEFGLDKFANKNFMNQVESTDSITGLDTNMDHVKKTSLSPEPESLCYEDGELELVEASDNLEDYMRLWRDVSKYLEVPVADDDGTHACYWVSSSESFAHFLESRGMIDEA
ncbi:unnamed protein product [Lactuca saligna]|uniref:Uncharacterized protein n=1 Tax=Lactuca saligna TaxID=75948 RepID=A0AA35VTX0_LACSI|nr:unnamed protein product [Lactuca saligna]